MQSLVELLFVWKTKQSEKCINFAKKNNYKTKASKTRQEEFKFRDTMTDKILLLEFGATFFGLKL